MYRLQAFRLQQWVTLAVFSDRQRAKDAIWGRDESRLRVLDDDGWVLCTLTMG